MRQEVERCSKAVELAQSGKKVAVICSGDPGIYAMAGLVFEILKSKTTEHRTQNSEHRQQNTDSRQHINKPCTDSKRPLDTNIEVMVIPGVAAFNACAARLGAPLMHDFASISMSDLLTPWEIIEKRLQAVASADFVIIIYNPKSKGRQDHIKKARDIILKYRSPDTPVGIIRAATRDNEKIIITDLENMLDKEIDMQSTVIIGNSQTFIWNNWMITPRGYDRKYRI